MTKKMIKVWAGIFMLLAGIFVGNMGDVQASITEDVAAIEAIWKRIEKLPTQAEKTISGNSAGGTGERAEDLYVWRRDVCFFSADSSGKQPGGIFEGGCAGIFRKYLC